ncbi:MAG: hypothetical protein ACKVG9_10440, partial [Rhodospirillales bacterium]
PIQFGQKRQAIQPMKRTGLVSSTTTIRIMSCVLKVRPLPPRLPLLIRALTFPIFLGSNFGSMHPTLAVREAHGLI